MIRPRSRSCRNKRCVVTLAEAILPLSDSRWLFIGFEQRERFFSFLTSAEAFR